MRIDQADSWFSKCVRERVDYRCERCGKFYDRSSTGLHASHIFGRVHKATRWHPLNAVAHCYACHQYLGANPVVFRDWAVQHLGADVVDALRVLHNTTFKTTALDRKEIAAHYREQHRQMLERRLDTSAVLTFDAWPGLPLLPTTP